MGAESSQAEGVVAFSEADAALIGEEGAMAEGRGLPGEGLVEEELGRWNEADRRRGRLRSRA